MATLFGLTIISEDLERMNALTLVGDSAICVVKRSEGTELLLYPFSVVC